MPLISRILPNFKGGIYCPFDNSPTFGETRRADRFRKFTPIVDRAGPLARIRSLWRSRAEPGDVVDFARSREELNITRRTIDSLPSVDSGIARYFAYCDLIGEPYLPPKSISARRRGSFFNTGATFGIYVSHLSKTCQLMGLPIDRNDNAADAAISGLKRARCSLSF